MANRFLTNQEVADLILRPWIDAVTDLMRDVPPSYSKLLPNPAGRDMMPIRVYGFASPQGAD